MPLVHHLNCATLCPVAAGTLNAERHLVCHCLLVELPDRLVLVDTGFGTHDLAGTTIPPPLRWLLGPRFAADETAVAQVRQLGFEPGDVRDILVTHLDLDHAGGLADFPKARVHLMGDEHAAALGAPPWELRYRKAHWAHGPDWQLHEAKGEPWRGFACVRDLPGLPPEILLVPLSGHTRGHTAIAVDTGAGWLLHAGDAYFHADEMAAEPRCPPGLQLFQDVVAADRKLATQNRGRLRELARGHPDVRVFCAHDPSELARLRQDFDAGTAWPRA